MKRYVFQLVTIAAFCCFPLFSHAQTDPPADPVDVPIDGGLSLLLAAGIGYGVKKMYDKRKPNVPGSD